MARHYIGAAKPKPRAEIRAAPSSYERTHPVGSAERFLDEAAKEALAAAAAGGVVTPRRAVIGAARAVAKEAEKYPDPLLAEAAKLPKDDLLKRAAKAEAFQKAMDAQNRAVAAAAALSSPAGRMATALAADTAGDLGVRQDAEGGNARRGRFKGWKAYKDHKEALAAEAAAVAFVNEGIAKAPPLSADDLADSRASAEWLKTHGRKGLVEEGTLPHIGRPRFYSVNGFMEGDDWFQGDRFSNTTPVDMDAYRKDPETYRKSGRWAVIPSVFADEDGVTRLHTADTAEAVYRKTGRHFGIYEGMDNANLGAEWDHHKGNAEWAERSVRQDAEGGDAGSGAAASEAPVSEAPQNPGGPRIVINPTTFRNQKDALCVAFNEGFRVWMEANGFEPQSEPTDAQRRFFSDTAYADDEVQLRRTILARVATFDTSVKDPTDDQLSETADFLDAILESDWCRNDWERSSVQRLARAVRAAVGAEPVEPKTEPVEPRQEAPVEARAADKGGETEDKFANQSAGQSDRVDQAEEKALAEREAAQQAGGEVPQDDGSGQTGQGAGDQRDQIAADNEAELNGPSIEPTKAIGDIGSRSLTDTKGMNGPSTEPSQSMGGGIDRSEFGRNGRIGIAARIVDPETGKSRNSLSMNGPTIKPARAIGDMGSRTLADTKSMNGPAVEPTRAIGDMGSTSLADTQSVNGPAIEPVRAIGDMGSTSLTDAHSMNGSALRPRRRIGDMGGRTLVNNRRRT